MAKDTLGEFEFLVLLAVMGLGDDAYGVPIVEQIKRRTGRTPSRASVYVTLQRLEKTGLVVSFRSDPRPERGGKARRYVQVLPAGARMVRETRAGLEQMWADVDMAGELS